MNALSRIAALTLALALPIVVPSVLNQSLPPQSANCGACVCITPGSTVTVPDGSCGITAPGGDTISAVGGPVTVTTDGANALTSVVMPAGVHADVDVVSGAAAFVVIGGGGSSAVVAGHGLALDVNLPAGVLTLTGTGNTVDDSNASASPARYVSIFAGPASNRLNMHGHAGLRVEGPWFVDP